MRRIILKPFCRYFDRYTLVGAAIAIVAFLAFTPRHTLAGIIQAIIPAAVPTANKQGNSSKFALASGTFTPGNCTETDGSGNLVDGGVVCNGVGGGTPGAFVFSSTTNAGPSNTGTETSLVGTVVGSTSIAANTFTNGAVLEAMSQGFFSLPAVADSITLKMKCGSTVIGSAATTLPAGILSNGSFRFWLRITARGSGAGGAFMTNGFAEFSGSALTASEVKVVNTSTVAFDFTTSCAFDITAQWGGAQSGESITGTNAGVWFPGAPVTSVGGLTGAVPGQGNGSKVQMAGTVSGTGAPLCTDAGGNTTTSGCAAAVSISRGTFASLPSCTTAGTIYLFTNSFYSQAECNGSSWAYFAAPGMLTPPVAANFGTTVNSPTTVTTFGGVQLSAAAHSGNQINAICKNLPTVPYTIDMGFTSANPAINFLPAGMCLTDGTKFACISAYADSNVGGPGAKTGKYTNSTTFSAAYSNSGFSPFPSSTMMFVRLADTGAGGTPANTRQMSYSVDNSMWVQLTAVSNTDFLTPTQVCLFVDANNASFGPQMWALHYLEH